MATALSPEEVQRGLTALGVTPHDLEAIRQAPYPLAKNLLQALKKRVRRVYKQLAFELHPDRTQGDAAKENLFVLVGLVLAEIDKTIVQPPPPPKAEPIFTHFTRVTPTPWQKARDHRHPPPRPVPTAFSPEQVRRIVKMRPR